MSRIERSFVAAMLSLLICAVASIGAVWAEGEEVRVYTNEDLKRFPTSPDSTVEVSQPSAEEWRFVTDYLKSQYSRLDADREYSMERARSEAELELIRRRANRQHYSLPLYWNQLNRWNGAPGRFPGRGSVGRIRRAMLPDGSIRPLHAGPTRAQVDYFKASRRSGADAFPSGSRDTSSNSRKGKR